MCCQQLNTFVIAFEIMLSVHYFSNVHAQKDKYASCQ